MKKRVEAFALAVIMLLSLVVSAFAQSITISPDKDVVKAGEDVVVTVKMNDKIESITSLAVNLHFNSDLFTYKSATCIDNASVSSKDGGTAPNICKVINWIYMLGNGTLNAGEFASLTFTAKEDINANTDAIFKADVNEIQMMPGVDEPTFDEKSFSVTVTPAGVEGYTVAAADATAITVGEKAQVKLTIGNKDVKTYNAYYLEVSYDSSILTYEGINNTDAQVKDDTTGTLKIAGYGKDLTCGTDNIVLTFLSKAVGEAKVTVKTAKVDAKANAAVQDAPAATILTAAATVTVNGYSVTLPDGFTSDTTTVKPGESFTFTATDKSKKYDFTGSTMGGGDVTIKDNGNGTYTVDGVTGNLVIKATEVAAKVKVNLSGDAVDTITTKSWGDATEVDAGTALWFMAAPNGKELVVTVNGEELTGVNMQGNMRYNIAADKVTGTELNIVVNYKAEDTITINGSGDAWSDVDHASSVGWDKTGKVTDKTSASLKIKPASGKTIDDYVVTINGVKQTLSKMGRGNNTRYMVTFVPANVAKDGIITIDVSYAKPEGPTINVDVFKYLDIGSKQSIFLVTATADKLANGQVLGYGSSTMYWSEQYGAYAWLVISGGTEDEVKTAAKAAVKAVTADKVAINNDGNVNLIGSADINDAQLVWNMYNAQYTDFDTVSVQKFLEADMNGDKTVDVADATAITAKLF